VVKYYKALFFNELSHNSLIELKMKTLTFADLIEGITDLRLEFPHNPTIEKATIDSRQATEGSLFFALRGEHKDGHDYVADAFSRGAIVAVVEREIETECCFLDTRKETSQLKAVGFDLPVCLIVEDSLAALQKLASYWRKRHEVRVVGVTGSVGKTTTKEMVASVLGQRFRTLKSRENYNTEIGIPLTLLELDPSYERVVLEMAMYDLGEIALLAEIAQPHIGVVTNVGPTHLERLGTIERIAKAKAELVEALPPDGVAVLNGDDPLVRKMAQKTRADVFYYGLDPGCDLWASSIESHGLDGVRFQFHYGRDTIHTKIPLLGRHSVHTALAATAVGLIEGESWGEIIEGLQNVAQLRLVVVPGPKGSTILDDTYNASPTSTIAALNLLEELDGRKIAVLGDMLELGSFEEEGHRKVGRRAVEVVEILITVGKRGRIIGQEAINCGMDKVFIFDEKDEAISFLRRIVSPGDFILIKGSRGMKMEEMVSALSRI
jgi:UDP-N-acetylmuramoyl-tripeptide--D-alanyl-D-alanine ligase